jgi:hypothetical protein
MHKLFLLSTYVELIPEVMLCTFETPYVISFKLSNQNFGSFTHLILLYLITLLIFSEKFKLQSTSFSNSPAHIYSYMHMQV